MHLSYPIMHHLEQSCARFGSEWCIVGSGTGALWDLWDWSNRINVSYQKLASDYNSDLKILVNSLWPNHTIWHHVFLSSLVQLMTCHLYSAKPLTESMMIYCQLDAREQYLRKLNQNTKLFFQENTQKLSFAKRQPFFRPQCVNSHKLQHSFFLNTRIPCTSCDLLCGISLWILLLWKFYRNAFGYIHDYLNII